MDMKSEAVAGGTVCPE